MASTLERTITEKVMGYIKVFRNTRTIGIYDNQEFWTATSAMDAKLKLVKKNENDMKAFIKTVLDEDVVQIFSDILLEQLPDVTKRQGYELFSSHKEFSITQRTFHALNSLVELSKDIAKATIQGDWKLLPSLQRLLEALKDNAIKDKLSKDDRQFVKSVLVMLYNLVMHDNAEIIHYVREKGLIDNIKPYMKCTDTDSLKMFSFLFLLYVSNEADACTDKAIIELLVNTTVAAVHSKEKEKYDFKSMELLRAIEKLSALDADKFILYDIGVVQEMITILEKSEDNAEIIICLGILTNIAFAENPVVAESIEKAVKDLPNQEYNNEEIMKAQQGLRWVLIQKTNKENPRALIRSHSRAPGAPANVAQAGDDKSDGATEDTTCLPLEKHIMISYQWESQEKTRMIKDYLKKNNLRVWFDEENMEGDIMDAMACAVENAFIVLICYSRKYKLSCNCRMEAQYAMKLKREIIPLRMEDYEPDGWLGLMIGTQLYYDFTKREDQKELIKLSKTLKKKKNCSFDDTSIMPKTVQPLTVADGGVAAFQSSRSTLARDRIEQHTIVLKNWSSVDLDRWFSEIGVDRKLLGVNTGGDVRTLIRMYKDAPSAFYKYMLKKVSLSDLTKFIEGSERLFSSEQLPQVNFNY